MTEYKTDDIDTARSDIVAQREATASVGVSLEQSQQAYSARAGLYEQTLTSLGRTAHVRIAECVANSFPRETRDSIKILDVGAGTGMVGKEVQMKIFGSRVTDSAGPRLKASVPTNTVTLELNIPIHTATSLKHLGFVHVDAFEPNEVMLDEARKRGLYENYYVDYLTEHPSIIPEDSYDAITGLGIFAESAHVPFRALDEMIRVVKPGGYVVLAARSSFVDGSEEGKQLQNVMEQLVMDEKWKKVTEDRLSDYTKNIAESGIIWKYQVM